MSDKLPKFDENGNLPPGIYTTSIDEIEKRFGGSISLKRSLLTKSFKLFYNFIKFFAIELYIDGSYVTKKLSPHDIDIRVILPMDFLGNTAAHPRMFDFLHGHDKYKLHVFSFIIEKDEENRKKYFHTFTHARPEDGGFEKGIIRIEFIK